MSVFEKRPLGMILAVMLCGFSFMATGMSAAKIAVSVLLAGALILLFLFPQKRKLILAAWIGLLSVSIVSELYFGIFFFPEARFGKNTREFTATVTDADYFDSQGAGYTLTTEPLDGSLFSSFKIRYTDFSATYAVGDRLLIRGCIGDVQNGADGFDAKNYYASLGIRGELLSADKITLLEEKADIPLTYRFRQIREKIAQRAVDLCGKEPGGLLAAVLLGEKSYLPPQMKLDFSAIGLSHLLALSGLHLTILTGGLYFLLRRLHVAKKLRILFSDLFAVAYVLLTGASPSVTRAALMLILGSLLYLFMHGKDGVTSLFVAVTVLFLIEPYAVFSVSIRLSAFATFGILVFAEMRANKEKPSSFVKRFLRNIGYSIAVSSFALGGTLLLSVNYFSGISLLAPLTTLVFSALIEIVLYLGIPVLISGSLIPIGVILKPFASLISLLSAFLADLPGLTASTQLPFIRVFSVAFTLAFFAFAVLKIKRKRLCTFALCALLFCGLGIGALLTSAANQRESILYERSGKDECIMLSDGGKHAVIEITDLSATDFRFFLSNRGDTAPIDTFFITHYDERLITSAKTLLSLVRIKEIALPVAKTDKEALIALAVFDAAKDFRTEVSFYGASDKCVVGNNELSFLYRSKYGDGAPRIMFSICRFDRLYSYFSAGVMEDENIKTVAARLYDASATAIFGSHGKTYPEGTVFHYSSHSVENLLISDERFLFRKSFADELKNVDFRYLPKKEELIR